MCSFFFFFFCTDRSRNGTSGQSFHCSLMGWTTTARYVLLGALSCSGSKPVLQQKLKSCKKKGTYPKIRVSKYVTVVCLWLSVVQSFDVMSRAGASLRQYYSAIIIKSGLKAARNLKQKTESLKMINTAVAVSSCGLCYFWLHVPPRCRLHGAPTAACTNLMPQHFGTSPTPCGLNCPFSLTLTAVNGSPPQIPMQLQYRCGSLHTSKLDRLCTYA